MKKPPTEPLTVRVPAHLKRTLEKMAAKEHRTVNSLIVDRLIQIAESSR